MLGRTDDAPANLGLLLIQTGHVEEAVQSFFRGETREGLPIQPGKAWHRRNHGGTVTFSVLCLCQAGAMTEFLKANSM